MERRNFLKALFGGVAGVITVPWIKNLFKKPDDSPWAPDSVDGIEDFFDFGEGDWTFQFWYRDGRTIPNEWHHFAQVAEKGSVVYYLDGTQTQRPSESARKAINGFQAMHIRDVADYKGNFTPIELPKDEDGWIHYMVLRSKAKYTSNFTTPIEPFDETGDHISATNSEET